MESPAPGQRWLSQSEPELGLGIIRTLEGSFIELHFPAAGETRRYARHSAPLQRACFRAGDAITLRDGSEHVIDAVTGQNGVLIYQCGSAAFPEAELADTLALSAPQERLLAASVDDLQAFALRAEAVEWRSRMQASPVRGFIGGRVDPIPHQMSIAADVTTRLLPRVLLADEVGLGKTIEAGLVLHRLHLTGRASRVLVLVPDALPHQWFIELLRRFNLMFSLFDEERCTAIEAGDPEGNPFLDSQIVLCPLSLLSGSEKRARQAADAGWDLLVVDEAHHLEWTVEAPGIAYQVVESIASRVPGVLLLTATPQQLGAEGHFARLRLLDPDRYDDLDAFLAESSRYEQVASIVDRILQGGDMADEDRELFSLHSPRVQKHAAELHSGDESARQRLVNDLLDEFGTGRVMFRNTRAVIQGFPPRQCETCQLAMEQDSTVEDTLIRWLAATLRELGDDKVLLICRTRKLAEDIHERLLREINVHAVLFHEGLNLMQRDRHAATFADPEGARLLICSEIGSEGRNFQFAQHLVLFDLPRDPELLEQRIGRLDRIGQKGVIHIHVPFVEGTEGEVLARWYHDGLDAFEHSLQGATQLLQTFAADVESLCAQFDRDKLDDLIHRTRELRQEVRRKLERGHNRLLELNSCKPRLAARIIERIREIDADGDFERFFIRVLDHLGMHVEEMSGRTWFIRPDNLVTDALPSLPAEGLTITFDRERALSRDHESFLTWDHPLVTGALDVLLGSHTGNAGFAFWKASGAEGLVLQTTFIAECIAPPALHAARFMPAVPIRVAVDHQGRDLTADAAFAGARLTKGDPTRTVQNEAVRHKLLPAMLSKAQRLAEGQLQQFRQRGLATMGRQLDAEIARLEDLQVRNPHVRPEEIDALRQQRESLAAAIESTTLRLDAVRLVLRLK
ncbi:MAG: DEAD/DEAH box helicase family protein [Prosthecobacter sp.]|jgi:ATP-dependent helicase HepA|uniref:helicase-related protein n=1 Tax=Prosthecobacter sp. TaxID=1965333 RepID=UPI001A05EB29|nr:helicase-related protein [Prosthecobacter sp.]MBE2283624.1 DEAD/DEAH box helicase family protein [Prosthecobacter sp.]